MRIDGFSSYLNYEPQLSAKREGSPLDLKNSNDSRLPNPREIQEPPQVKNDYTPGAIVNISQQALDYQRKLQADEGLQKIAAAEEIKGCQTCKDRKYVDVSNDPSVSFQTPQAINSSQSFSMVRAHEYEHVTNEQAKAQKEDRKVVSQTVSLSMSICPECGTAYVSGGVTRTVTKSDNKPEVNGELPVSDK
ncbi:MAG: hypothetical protein FWC12_02490 [Treponema sp.]|nr:hypothetical protein [Treponema sp.]